MEPDWACPRCGGGLDRSDHEYSCASCETTWPVIDGIPHFVSEARYWGEIPEPKLQRVLAATRTQHWKEVLGASEDPDIARAFTFIANLNRTSWQYFLPSGRGKSALCVGEGMGATAHALAANYACVVALEPVRARVEFMRQRFRQDRIDNVRIVRSGFPDVPFARQSFDLVVFNGVIEWLPSGQPSEDPTKVQLGALRKACELLRPGGHVYVGIENRWCYEYFLGAKDPHVGVPWVTILPRRVAHRLMRRAGSRRYDAYLYGSRGYRRLLRTAGFVDTQVFVAKDSYNDPAAIVPLQGAAPRYFFRTMNGKPSRPHRRVFRWMAGRLGILGQVQYAFIVLGTKP